MFEEENADNRNAKFSEMVSRSMNCYTGTRENSIGRFMFKNPADHLDKKLASDYFGGTLKAIAPVTVVNSPNGSIIRAVLPGEIVGKIYSYIENPKGSIWWMLENGGYVKQSEGVFDIGMLDKSIRDLKAQKQAAIDAKVTERTSQNDSTLYKLGKAANEISFGDLFGKFKALLLIIVVGLVSMAVLRFV